MSCQFASRVSATNSRLRVSISAQTYHMWEVNALDLGKRLSKAVNSGAYGRMVRQLAGGATNLMPKRGDGWCVMGSNRCPPDNPV